MKSILSFPFNYIVIPVIIIYVVIKNKRMVEQGLDWYKGLKKPENTPQGKLLREAWIFVYVLFTAAFLWYWDVSYPGWFKIASGTLMLGHAYYSYQWHKSAYIEHDLPKTLQYMKYWLYTIGGAIIVMVIHSPIATFMMLPYLAWVLLVQRNAKQITSMNNKK